MSKTITYLFLLLLTHSLIFGQTNKFTLNGYIKDAESGETLIGAYVYDITDRKQGTSTNVYGFYSLTLPEGKYQIEASFIGYENKRIEVELNKDLNFDFELGLGGIVLEQAVEISAKRKDQNVESTKMGVVELAAEQIKEIPALMGEVDVMRAIQLLPGVVSSGEGNTGLYVRGGGPDQNLILLDEAVVYNPGHLFGFFSVFNSDAVKSTTLHKGNMPAEFGGRLSSVVDLTMRDGNNKRFQARGGIGLISSRLTLEGPIQKDKSSFLISGRRTYADLLAKPFLKANDLDGNGYYFYDLNVKANYQFSGKDRIFLSGYFGRDVFDFRSSDGLTLHLPWGNETATLRWNHLFSKKLFMNLSAIYNRYTFQAESEFNDFQSNVFSGIRDWNVKLDFDFFPNPNHTIKFGANYTYHKFSPYTVDAVIGETEIETDSLNTKRGHEMAIYVQDEFTIGQRLKLNVGLRASLFQQVGPFNQIVYNESRIPTDTLFFDSGEPIATYWGLAPRLGIRYALNSQSSIKGAITVANQYVHLVARANTSLPTDLWVSSSERVKPQRGIQYSLGYFQNFADNLYEASVEVYYKDMNNQIEFADDVPPEITEDVENQFVFGTGRSYGLELFLKKRKGRFTGWIGYTLSRTTRTFPDLNDGEPFTAKYDRTHDLSVVGTYKLSDRWGLSGNFVYGTGQALTLPSGFIVVQNWVFPTYDGPRNDFRLKPYHRLDLAATYKMGKKKKSDLVISVYNIYNRFNQFFIYPAPEVSNVESGEVSILLKEVAIFRIIPSVTWNFKF